MGLDRDLYKLYYLISAKLEGARTETVDFFVQDSVLDTNDTWAGFRSPFPLVERIGGLYGMYKNKGSKLIKELEEIEASDATTIQKKEELWNKLLTNTQNMKQEFGDSINKLNSGREVTEYQEQRVAAASASEGGGQP